MKMKVFLLSAVLVLSHAGFQNSKTGYSKIPTACAKWFDGCNTCVVSKGQIQGCTKRQCFRQGTPKCTAYSANLGGINNACTDYKGWTDSDNDGCSSYKSCTTSRNADSHYTQYARTTGRWARVSALKACCACGGGTSAPKKTSYNCYTREVWTAAKNKWCCANKKMGCSSVSKPKGATLCDSSPPQMCKMLCPASRKPACPAGQCLMRVGSCCTYKCQSPDSGASDSQLGDGAPTYGQQAVPAGGQCSTTPSRRGPPKKCASGFYCHITNAGHPETDMPNSGICATSTQHHTNGAGGIRNKGQSCGYVYGMGNVGKCASHLSCKAYQQAGGPQIADAPSTCQPKSTGSSCSGKRDRDPKQCADFVKYDYTCASYTMRSGCEKTCCMQKNSPAGLKEGATCAGGMMRGPPKHYGKCAKGLQCMTWNQANPNAGVYMADGPSNCRDPKKIQRSSGGPAYPGRQHPVDPMPSQHNSCSNYHYKNECQQSASQGCVWTGRTCSAMYRAQMQPRNMPEDF